MSEMNWIKQPAIEGGSKPCLCCGAIHTVLPLDALIAVGFGSAMATKGGDIVYSEPQGDYEESALKSCADIEVMAQADPDHDWQISFYAPLYESVYQRHSENHWVLIRKGRGFA